MSNWNKFLYKKRERGMGMIDGIKLDNIDESYNKKKMLGD